MIALKRSRSNSYKEYEQEQKALFRMQSLQHPHLVQVIASFQVGQDYFFMFPWADGGNLMKAWEDKSKEFRAIEMIKWAFKQMKKLVSGVRKLHHPEQALSEENGRHGDLRPEKILIFLDKEEGKPTAQPEDELGTLRITDAGLAKFHTKITTRRLTGRVTTGGYMEYAPPEALEKGVRSRKYNLWSLGCIFLESAFWLLVATTKLGIFDRLGDLVGPTTLSTSSKIQELLVKTLSKLLQDVKNFVQMVRKDDRCWGKTCSQGLRRN